MLGNEIKMPMPKIPELTETPQYTMEEVEPDTEEEENEAPEVLVNAIGKIIAFISTLGMPTELIVTKTSEYEEIAHATGLSKAVADLIEYYFPYIEDRPEIAVLFAVGAYISYVAIDRKQTIAEWEKKHPKKKNEKKIQKVKQEREKTETAVEEQKKKQMQAVMNYNNGGGF